MPATDEERLVVLLEARIKDLEKNMAKASGVTAKTYREMSLGSKKATANMERDMIRSTTRINQALATTSTRIGSFGKAFIGGLAVGAAVGALEGIRQAAVESTKSILEMGDQAKMAGVNFKAFQRLKFVAEQNRIGVDALTDGLKELSLRADEFIVTGAGSAAEAFKRLGYSAEELKEKLKEPDELFVEIIGKLERLDKAAQIRISDELFGGTGGEKFVQLIAKGERGIRDQIKAAEDLGLVMDNSMIKKAEEVDQKFQLITTTIGTHLKAAIVDAVSAWFRFLDSYNDFKDQNQSTLEDKQAKLGMQRVELENERMQILAGESGNLLYRNPDGPAAKGRIQEIDIELAKLAETEAQIAREIGRRNDSAETVLDAITVPGGSRGPFTGKGFLDLIGHAEGTDKGRGYNETLGYGKFTGGDRNLVLMTLDDIDAMQSEMLRDPANTHNSSAVGRYQIVQKTLRGLRKSLGISGSEYFSPDMQDRLAQELMRQRGNNPSELRNEWEGLRGIDDATIRSNFDASSLSMPGQDAGIVAKNEKLKEQSDAYAEVVARAREFIDGQHLEGQALDMTKEAAARLRYEQELLNDARQAGVDLTPTQIESIKQLAGQMAAAEEQTRRLALSQDDLRERAEEFGQQAKSVVGGFISDLKRGASASDALRNALSRVGDMMLDSALNQIFGGGGVKGGGLFGPLISSIFGGIGKNARGTEFWRGGPTWVGERGAEIINAPRGARITPNHNIPAGGGGGGGMKVDVGVSVDQNGNLQAFVKNVVKTEAPGIARNEAQARVATYQKQQERGGTGTMTKIYNSRKG